MRRSDSGVLERVVGLLEKLENAEPWEMTRDELEEFVEDACYDAGELLEERRRQLIIAAMTREQEETNAR